ncbi:MAG: LysM domain-containing protein [Desulfobacterales bacterium]
MKAKAKQGGTTTVLAGLLVMLATIGFAGRSAADGLQTETENGWYYTVQKGDTLWDLSRRFSQGPWVWPELWQENSRIIANPHLIYPGQKLKLARQRLPRPEPPASPEGASAEGIYYFLSTYDRVGFIRREPVPPTGVITQGRNENRRLLSEGDLLFVQPVGDSPLTPGSWMTVYRTFDPVFSPDKRRLLGTQHLLCGVVEILERGPEFATARLIKSYRPVRAGDRLMPYEKRPLRIPVLPAEPGIDGAFIRAEEEHRMFAEANIAFIDRGRNQGIQVGQIYSVYEPVSLDPGFTGGRKIAGPPQDYGEVLVLHVEEETATVLVTDSSREFFAGDRVRTPAAAAR